MPVKWKHGDEFSMYYCTFTCYKWLHLFEIVNGYDMVYEWFASAQGLRHLEFSKTQK